jgi:DNA invertase Pin-like site-specific DNA recombinase
MLNGTAVHESTLPGSGSTLKPAIAYLRQTGPDAPASQRRAIIAYAARAGYEIVAEFQDEGSDRVDARPGFAKLLRQIEIDGAHTIIVERASDFAADPISQEVGFMTLRERGIELIATDDPAPFVPDTPTAAIIAQAVEISTRLDRAISAALTRGTNQRARARTGKSWRRTYAEMVPDATLLAKRLNQTSRKNGARISLREISAKLAESGFVTRDGKPFHPEAIRRMLKGAWPKSATA